jgi:hypothetical protein
LERLEQSSKNPARAAGRVHLHRPVLAITTG